MFVILLMHAIVNVILTISLRIGYIVIFTFMPLTILVLISHYAMVLDEMAVKSAMNFRVPCEIRFYDDLLRPLGHVLTALFLSYLPLIVMLVETKLTYKTAIADLGLLVVGSCFFPAVFLTAVTSGTLLNLWPPRVLGTFAAIGPRYLMYPVVFMGSVFVLAVWHCRQHPGTRPNHLVDHWQTHTGYFWHTRGLSDACGGHLSYARFLLAVGSGVSKPPRAVSVGVAAVHPRPNRRPPPRNKPRYVTPQSASSQIGKPDSMHHA